MAKGNKTSGEQPDLFGVLRFLLASPPHHSSAMWSVVTIAFGWNNLNAEGFTRVSSPPVDTVYFIVCGAVTHCTNYTKDKLHSQEERKNGRTEKRESGKPEGGKPNNNHTHARSHPQQTASCQLKSYFCWWLFLDSPHFALGNLSK